MEKSIETIWSDGFSEKENLVVPKIDKLFKKKSKLIFEKFKKKFWIYNYRIVPAALVFAIGHSYLGRINFGIYIIIVSLAFFLLNIKIWKSFKTIDINLNSYQYLLAFRNSIKKMFSIYSWVYGISTPILLFIGLWLLPINPIKLKWLNELQTPHIIIFLVISSLAVTLYSVFGNKLEMKITYDRLIKKLDNTIADMEELKIEKNKL